MNTTTILPISLDADVQSMERSAAGLAADLRAGEAVAVKRWRQYHQLMELSQEGVVDAALAPQIVAREFGFADWEILIVFMTEMGRPGSAVHVFETAVEAVINGDEHALIRELERVPGLARARSLRIHQATLLHYTSANGIEGFRQRTPANIVAIARMLLGAGAEVDAPLMDGGHGTTLGLVATSVHPARAGVQLELMGLLLDAGAAVNGLAQSWQPLMAALANGRPEAAALLAERGAYRTIVAAAGLGREEWVKSFFDADGAYVPTREQVWHVPEEPQGQLVRAFMYACIYGHTAIAAFLVGKGVDPGVQDWDAYTGLHWAAHGGHVGTVRYLLELKAPLELKNCYGGTVLGQLLWSASNNVGGWGGNDPGADYTAIAALLIAAGSVVEPGTLAWWKGQQEEVRSLFPGMEAVLRRQAADRRPVIVSPVSRHLAVGDIERSIRYYTEVLGFALDDSSGTPAVVYGHARIFFHTDRAAVDSTGELRPAGSAMVFFGVDEPEEFWDKLYARGAQPTAPEKINWIKYTVVEVRDPDGHRLLFGRSFHNDPVDLHTPPGKGQLRQIMPALPCKNVGEAVKYYRDVLGFSVNYQQDDLGVMDRDEVRLLLVAKKDAGTTGCCIYIENADRLYGELMAKGALVQGEPVSQPWGLREFRVLDPDGNAISFAQTFE